MSLWFGKLCVRRQCFQVRQKTLIIENPQNNESAGEAEWMIQEMDWIPSDFPSTGTTALMRIRFSEAVAAYSLQPLVHDAVQRRCAAPVLPPAAQDTADVGVDPRVNLIEAEYESVEIRSHFSTELIDSDLEGQDAVVDVVDMAPECEFFNLSPADPPSPDCREGNTRRGPPSPDPAEQPDNKRRRPQSCVLRLSFPVLRQATALPTDGIFEYYEGLVIPRSASVLLPSEEMVIMACLRAIQCSPMPDIRQLTACARRWAAERPRCLSLAVKEADSPAEQQAPSQAEANAQAVLQAPFGIAALSQAASQAMSSLQRPARPNPGAEAQAPPQSAEDEWISNRRMATMEWLTLP